MGAQTLPQCVGPNKVDYVVASHVIEHVPDLITWLEEISGTLTHTGEVRLAIPDRRFTFDYFRNETRFCDAVAAWMVRARRPQPLQLADHILNITRIDTAAAWREKPDPDTRTATFNFPSACDAIADSLDNGTYYDVHCWIFTPASFAALMQDILRAGLTDFGCLFFHDTEPGQLEFIVAMKRMADPAEALRSWVRMQQAARDLPAAAGPDDPPAAMDELKRVVPALQETLGGLAQVLAGQNEAQENLTRLLESQHQAAEREAALTNVQAQLDLIRRSTSWRITAPIRRAVDTWRRP